MQGEGSKQQRDRGFLFILILGVLCGLGVTTFFVHYYSPSGKYPINTVLLSPVTLKDLWYQDQNPKTGGQSRYIFKEIEWDGPGGKQSVSLEDYAEWYQAISGAKNREADTATEEKFRVGTLPRIVIWVKTESNAPWQNDAKIFQEVHFAPDGNTFRVQLHEDEAGNHWAYFYLNNVYPLAQQTLLK